MSSIDKKKLYEWCRIPWEELEGHPELKIPFRIVKDSKTMGELMAREFIEEIKLANTEQRTIRAIVPCGPKCWYKPFVDIVNKESVSLKHLVVFHMDECLDWEGNLLPMNHPYNFRNEMERYFYSGVESELSVPLRNRIFPEPDKVNEIKKLIAESPIDLTLGGWGQDGHLAYNQARRNPYSTITVEQLRNSELRIQENNWDTIITLAHRTFGAAYQFVPPMSITLGMKESLSSKKVRVFSDTGAWKQTALRVALFSDETVEYPMTLLQNHPDAIITATIETARHPISENTNWEFEGVHL
jgi:glucosamine-6-phosphate deaminase